MKSVCKEKIFKSVFNKYSELVRNYIYYKCGNIEQAEDISQDTFFELWKNCKKVPLDKAKSFLLRVAQNKFYNEAAHSNVVLKYKQSAIKAEAFSYSPEFLLEEKEFMSKLQQAIANLPVKEREVFLLSRKDKKTYREIADIVGISQKGVERRMHLALLKLRKKIGISI